MSSTIHNCSYNPKGEKNFTPIQSLTPLQSGDLNISYLIHEIAEKDFGYHGTEKYTLTLCNSKMILEIWDRPDGLKKQEFGTLTLNGSRAWELTKPLSNDVTIKEDPAQISNHVNHTLNRIRQAYEKATSSIPSPQMNSLISSEGSASLNSTSSPTTAPIVNNYITCNPEPAEILTPFLQINEDFFLKLQEQLGMFEREIISLNWQIEDLTQKQLEDENLLKILSECLLKLQKKADEEIDILAEENHKLEELLKKRLAHMLQVNTK